MPLLRRIVHLDFVKTGLASRSESARFHEDSAPTSYLGYTEKTCWTEIVAWLPDADRRKFRMLEVDVSLTHLLDLTDPLVRDGLGVSEADLIDANPAICRGLAQRLRGEGVEGLITFSAKDRPDGRVLVLFLDNLRPTSRADIVGVRRIGI